MINKREGVFHDEDKQLLKAFAAFAAKSLQTLKTVPIMEAPKQELIVNDKFIPTTEDRENVKSWSFDVWKYNTDGLIRNAIAMFENFNLIQQFNIPFDRLVNLLHALSKTYRDVPYHNFWHAVDVLQTVFLFLWHGKTLQGIFSPLEILGLLCAALCHDVDHGGLNNAFHVKAQTPLAVLYKDTSVLETHHCSRSITLLSEVDNDILSGLSDQQYSDIWKTIIQAILATDMSLHFALLGQFENFVKTSDKLSENTSTPGTLSSNF